MKSIVHGSIAACLFLLALMIGLTSVYIYGSVIAAAVYFVSGIMGFEIILFFYCRKCCGAMDNCMHLGFGKLTRFFKPPAVKKYSVIDYLMTMAGVLILIVFPQYWLLNNSVIMAAFWILITLAVTEILFFVCYGCSNEKCIFCRNCNSYE
ncbi:MAG: hypothetical protein JW982_01570 [Spirochaetes bacterium]|nr:hypothetical protein [Spirochaetota bacterium]